MGNAYQRGLVLYRTKRYAMAADEFRKELSDKPNDPLSLAMLGLSLSFDGRRKEGLEATRQAVANGPDTAYCHYAYAVNITREPRARWFGKFRHRAALKHAIPHAMEAIRLDQDNADFLSLMAAIYLDLSHKRQALQWADKALEADPNHVRASTHRARALMALGRRQTAATTLDNALRVDPENASVHAVAGWNSLGSGQQKKALLHFQESVRLDPTSQYSREGLSAAKRAKVVVGGSLIYVLVFAAIQVVRQMGGLNTTEPRPSSQDEIRRMIDSIPKQTPMPAPRPLRPSTQSTDE